MAKKRVLGSILLWGACWGIFEATGGFILHQLPVNVGYLIWFPAAFFFLDRCYKETGKPWAAILMGIFAASIKLLNLFFPLRVDKVINPAVSMVLESLAFAIVIAIAKKAKNHRNAEIAFCASILWRGFYLLYLLAVPYWMYKISVLADGEKLIHFLVTETFFNSLVIYAYLAVKDMTGKLSAKKAEKKKAGLSKVSFACITALAVAADIALTLFL